MTTQLRWHIGLGSAWCYAAAREALAPPEAESLAPDSEPNSAAEPFSAEVAALTAFLTAERIAPRSFFSQLAALAPSCDARRDLAHKVLTKLLGRHRAETLTPLCVGLLGACERVYAAGHPQILEELRLRERPLRELWEARGPGLLAGVGRRTDKSLIVESATVALVPPLVGGGGEAFPTTNVVRFEGVLANPIAELPETVRLAWLVSQLATDQLEPVEPIDAGRLLQLAGAAMLPPILEAAADLELVSPDDPTLLATAAEAWGGELLQRPGVVDVVSGWWQAARNSGREPGLSWSVRLAALDRLLIEHGA